MKSFNKKPKLVLFISEDWYFWSHRLPIAQAAIDANWDVYLTTRISTLREQIQKENIHLIPLTKFRRRFQSPAKEFLSFIEILSIYRKIKPDIVHQVAFKPIIMGTIAARIAGIQRIINAFAGLGFLFTSKNKKKLILKGLTSFLLRNVFNTKRVRLILQNTDDLNLMVSTKIVSKHQAKLIKGSGVNHKTFKLSSEPSKQPLILLPSRMLWDKGVGEFVKAARILNSDGRTARFVLVGAPDSENPASIPVSVLEKWQDDGVVEWWGHHTNMPEIYAQAHIVCLPSYREGLPKVLLEASASGRPIVTTNTTGCKEVVRQGENGILIPPRDAKALVNALRTLLDDSKLRVSMGMKGREIVMKEYSEEKIVKETISLYSTMLSKK